MNLKEKMRKLIGLKREASEELTIQDSYNVSLEDLVGKWSHIVQTRNKIYIDGDEIDMSKSEILFS